LLLPDARALTIDRDDRPFPGRRRLRRPFSIPGSSPGPVAFAEPSPATKNRPYVPFSPTLFVAASYLSRRRQEQHLTSDRADRQSAADLPCGFVGVRLDGS
jgi:hypothetical protein